MSRFNTGMTVGGLAGLLTGAFIAFNYPMPEFFKVMVIGLLGMMFGFGGVMISKITVKTSTPIVAFRTGSVTLFFVVVGIAMGVIGIILNMAGFEGTGLIGISVAVLLATLFLSAAF